jgi:mRNA-degrading endonuclease RelE of RelBE toxin-antitoxin system
MNNAGQSYHAGVLRLIMVDPFDRTFTCELKNEWEGCRRAGKGKWRVIYNPPEDNIIHVVHIHNRVEKAYRK